MSEDKRAATEQVVGEILRLMGIRARLEVKDLPAQDAEGERPAIPASVSVALHLDEEVPGIVAGKRSQVVESMQFLANKIVNRGPEKKWINIGIGAHPEPRIPGQKQKKERAPKEKAQAPSPAPAPEAAAAVPAPAPAAPREEKKKRREKVPGEAKPRRAAAEEDEAAPEVADDPELQRLGRELAEKAAQFGRFYGVLPMNAAERANLSRGAQGVADVRVKMEGEGRHRRVVFVPANPRPMPKKSALPDYDEEELED